MEPRPVDKFISFLKRRRRLLIFLGVLLCLFIFKGTLYRACVSYELVRERNPVSDFNKNRKLTEEFSKEKIIESALDSTAELLSFTTGKCPVDVGPLRKGGKTNCIGYAEICAFLCNQSFLRGKHTGGIKAEPYVAKIYVFGFNIHILFDSPFWADHDVVVVTDMTTSEKIVLDPTLYDYTGVGVVCERK